MTTSSSGKLQKLLPELFESKQLPGDPYLRFHLTPEYHGLLPMHLVQESVLIPAVMITPLPNMAESVIGLISSREQVFCVLDLPQLLLDTPLSSYTREYHVIVVRLNLGGLSKQEHYLGLAVAKIEGMTRLLPENLQTTLPPGLPQSLPPFIEGYCLEQSELLVILNIPSLIHQAIRSKML